MTPIPSKRSNETVLLRMQGKRPADARMLAQQQVRLLTGMSRLLQRLLRSLLWPLLRPQEQRRVQGLLASLDNDLELARLVARTPPVPSVPDEQDPGLEAHGNLVPPVAGNGQEALP